MLAAAAVAAALAAVLTAVAAAMAAAEQPCFANELLRLPMNLAGTRVVEDLQGGLAMGAGNRVAEDVQSGLAMGVGLL